MMTHDRRGTILVASFWIMAIVSILAMGIGYRMSLEARLARYTMDRLKERYLAKAGIVMARELLVKDSADPRTSPYDSLRECGIAFPADPEAKETPDTLLANVRLGNGTYTASMTDEERRININRAEKDVIDRLIGPEAAAAGVGDAIIAWRSPTPNPAEDQYYQALSKPYVCRHAPFITAEELLLVRGVTPQLFADIEPFITVYGDPNAPLKVNVNTAPRRVLLAVGLFAIEKLADEIIAYRAGEDAVEGTADDRFFTTLTDLTAVFTPIEYQNLINSLKNNFTTKSDYFRIDATGLIDNARVQKRIVAIVKRGATEAERGGVLLSYREY